MSAPLPAAPLAPLLSPAATAVIGASRNRAKVGGMVLANLLDAGYRGSILPVNPAAAGAGETVQGLTPWPPAATCPTGWTWR